MDADTVTIESETKRTVLKAGLLLLTVLEGLFSFYILVRVPSEAKSSLLFGFSPDRLVLIAANLLLILVFLALFLIYIVPGLKFVCASVERFWRRPGVVFGILFGCWIVFIACAVLFLIWFLLDVRENVLLTIFISRTWGLLLWGILIALQTTVFFAFEPGLLRASFSPFRVALFFTVLMLGYFAFFACYRQVNRLFAMASLAELGGMILLPCVVALVWTVRYRKWAPRVNEALLCLLIGTLTFMVYRSTALWVNHWETDRFTYWHQLADAFLHGKLYLTDPDTLHDLTLYNGHWYVPNPPLPAILLMPFVWLLGVDRINMTVVAAVIGALNTVAVFLMLRRAAARSTTNCGLAANLWLTAVFAFGTNHYWLSTTGQIWFISQLVTVLFVTLACLSAIEGWSGWLTGLFLGLAVLARPNVFPMAIFLAGVTLWRQTEFPKILWRALFSWAIKAALPVIIAACVLLGYNYLRFEDWLDFGYVTINGADWILDAVRKYGMFHPYFIPANLDAMFFRLPELDFSGERFFFQPDETMIGFSIFVMTPPLIFLFRRLRRNWWTISAWVSIFLTTGLLLCYHNTGASQVGYRYLLDMIAPILLLMGVGIGKRPGTIFKILAALAFLVNALSVYWWSLMADW